MTKNICRAKASWLCQFHRPEAYKYAMEGLALWKKRARNAENRAEEADCQEQIDKYLLRIDASKKGFKLLRKEFNQAVKVGSFEQQMLLADRFKAVARLLAEHDGYVDEFRQAEQDAGMFGYTSLVLEKGAVSDVVETPIGNGTQWFVAVADRVAAEPGYEVVDLALIFDQATPEIEGAEQEEIRVRLLGVAQQGELRTWMKSLHDERTGDWIGNRRDHKVAVRGVTYTEPSGRKVVVRSAPIR